MDFKFLKVLQSLLITYSYINHTKKKKIYLSWLVEPQKLTNFMLWTWFKYYILIFVLSTFIHVSLLTLKYFFFV